MANALICFRRYDLAHSDKMKKRPTLRPYFLISLQGVSGMLFYAVNRSAGQVHVLEMLTFLGILALPSIATSL